MSKDWDQVACTSLALVLAACATTPAIDGDAGAAADIGQRDAGATDAGIVLADGGPSDVGAPDSGPSIPLAGLCEACAAHDDCAVDARCLPFGENSLCFRPCATAGVQGECPWGFVCGSISVDASDGLFCLPFEGCCVDEDGDDYGQGEGCPAPDCNDVPAFRPCMGVECLSSDDPVRIRLGDAMQTPEMGVAIYPGADEYCDGIDQDCDNEVDEECLASR